MSLSFKDKLTNIKGIGTVRASLFSKLGIENIGALLYYFPRTYTEFPYILKDFSDTDDVDYENPKALFGKLLKKPVVKRMRSTVVTTACLLVGNISVDLVWFNLPHIAKSLAGGGEFVYFGKLKKTAGDKYKMEQPAVYKQEKYETLVGKPIPVYPLTKDLKNTVVQDAVKKALEEVDEGFLTEYLDDAFLSENNLCRAKDAIFGIHFPKDYDELKICRKRLVFDEFFNFFLAINESKNKAENIPNNFKFENDELFNKSLKALPFTLTDGQMEALNDIKSDLYGKFVTQRMIQADVGSGKTVLAFLAMVYCAENGYKSAIMAPTEVLATQHYNTFVKFCKLCGVEFEPVLLTGKMSASEKKAAREKLSGDVPIFAIGTHALIQNSVEFKDLALVVVDEQHRFGVKQRKTLGDKGGEPFSLVMSATPIPRSLAMILYGDMNITIIRDVPKKRLPIKNAVIKNDMKKKAYQFVINEINKGHQAYIICPLVDKSEKTEAANVVEYSESLKALFPNNIKIAMLHGKMSSDEKNEIMSDFAAKKYDILVSTTVIEVGIDVPNATVIMIENATRFGLSQLHQLRGRVGRGESQSYCIFMDDTKGSDENERLSVISKSNDGFLIANEDMKLRGPGELFGLRQSGGFGFQLGDIYTDSDILMLASKKAGEFFSEESLMALVKDGLCRERLSWNNWYNI